MTDILYLLLGATIGYVFGAIPFGWIFVRLTKGVDLRNIESGRTGGTNAMRAAGPVVGGLTAIGDVLKGAAAIWIARALFGDVLSDVWLPWAEIAIGVMTIVGHNWSVFLGWEGGAGTGPNVGWATAVWWPTFPISMVVVLGVLYLTGMASLASLAMGVTIPLAFAVLYLTGVLATPAYAVGGVLTLLVVTWALRPNIQRILAGEERMVGPAARQREKATEKPKERRRKGGQKLKAQRTESG
jgi:glycerol-3-phosphate acyltransferase PlsY